MFKSASSIWAILLVSYASNIRADTGSVSISCSGEVRICNDLGTCKKEYFYAYTYQYAFFFRGKLMSELHSFQFSGALRSANDYKFLRATDRHMLYHNDDLLVAMPWRGKNDGLFFKQRQTNLALGPAESMAANGWQRICLR